MTSAARISHAEQIFVDGPAGALEVELELTTSEPRAIAVICHPHPLHGGTMGNKVVTTLSRTLVRHGVAGVRFNFRGVGRSQGRYDDGEGELADALAIADWVVGRFGAAQPLLLAGFSFGGAVAYRAAAERRPLALITVAPAVDRIPPSTPEPECDWLLVQGSADEIVAPAAVRAWLAALARAPAQVWLPGVGHFFHGELGALARALTDFLNQDETGADRAQSPHYAFRGR